MFNPANFVSSDIELFDMLHNEAEYKIDASHLSVFGIKNQKHLKFPGSKGRIIGIKFPNGLVIASLSHEEDEIAFAPFPGMDFKEVKPIIDSGDWVNHIHVTIPFEGTTPEEWRSICKDITLLVK